MKNSKKMTMLVCSSDGYNDLWEPFFKLLCKNWENIDFRIILNTEKKSFSSTCISVESLMFNEKDYLKFKKNYGYRMIKHLEAIETEYTLLMLDDFFIRTPVNIDLIDSIIKWMENDTNIACFSFDVSQHLKPSEIYAGFGEMNRFSPYKLNMQAGIWRTQRLMKYWKNYDNPWIWELLGNYQTFDNVEDKFYALLDMKYTPIYYGYKPEGMGVYRGKWVLNDVEELFRNNEIYIDYSIRGIYDSKNAKKVLPNLFVTLLLIIRRVKIKYALSILFFEFAKKIKLLFNLNIRYENHTDYLSDRYSKRGKKNV